MQSSLALPSCCNRSVVKKRGKCTGKTYNFMSPKGYFFQTKCHMFIGFLRIDITPTVWPRMGSTLQLFLHNSKLPPIGEVCRTIVISICLLSRFGWLRILQGIGNKKTWPEHGNTYQIDNPPLWRRGLLILWVSAANAWSTL